MRARGIASVMEGMGAGLSQSYYRLLNGRLETTVYFDRFDICEAYYMYARDYHDGQWGKLYHVLCYLQEKLGFRPSPMLDFRSMSENASDIYDRLVSGEIEVRDRRR
jgi:hypothetical protein